MADIAKEELAPKISEMQVKLGGMLKELEALEGSKLEPSKAVETSPTGELWRISYTVDVA